ncbi:NupC/NupG family nucleoside CNT transporter [bacterium]|nr:NupC/NupG family nucleoside CNT transporter [bacterium]
MHRLFGVLGLITLLGIAFLMSNNKRKINPRTVIVGISMQFVLGVLLLKWETGVVAFRLFAGKVNDFLQLADHGARFLFGNIVNPEYMDTFGFQFAFGVLPVIIFFSAFMGILYYLGIMQIVVGGLGRFMRWAMGTSGSESLSCSANIFVGQTEAPLLIKPFLNHMTKSELLTVMVGGFATIQGGLLAGYIKMGVSPIFLIIASAMSAPAALVVGKIIFPETEKSETSGGAKLPKLNVGSNILDAAAKGTTDGLHLALNVAAMLVAFIALIAVADSIMGWFDRIIDGYIFKGALMESGEYAGYFPGSLKTFFGTLLAPLAFLMGVPWKDAAVVGNLLGTKLSINEFVAYAQLGAEIKSGILMGKSEAIATFALCGFANFSSIGIQIGGIAALAPNRRSDLAQLGLKAMFGGAIASFMTATIVGILY